MPINFIPNDPSAGSGAPGIRVQSRRPNRPATRADFTLSNPSPEGRFAPGTPGFLFWQCREGALAALEAWEGAAGVFRRWQRNRRRLLLLQDAGIDINAFYDRASFSFFHRTIAGTTFFSGASTDVVAHEIGHGLLDAMRPDLWDAPFLESGAFHEAFGDCVAVLTALNDRDTRRQLLAATTTLRRRNFLESTAENLSEGIRRLVPSHNAAEPRHAFNDFQFQIPETLPMNGGPGELINEVHSFGMLFSGCFYDLIAEILAAQTSRTEAALLASARTAGAILAGGASSAVVTPRFFQSVGRAMVLADESLNDGEHRDRIRSAFERHGIMLGANALLAPSTVLEGAAPAVGRRARLGDVTRKDLTERLGVGARGRLTVDAAELSGRRFARVVHTRPVELGPVDRRLRGVTIAMPMTVMVGASGERAAVMGQLPDVTSTEREVHAFVGSLLEHAQIELASPGSAAAARSISRGRDTAADRVSRVTHRIESTGGKKALVRVRFHCPCDTRCSCR